MRDGHNHNGIAFQAIDQAVGKAVDQSATEAGGKFLARVRVGFIFMGAGILP